MAFDDGQLFLLVCTAADYCSLIWHSSQQLNLAPEFNIQSVDIAVLCVLVW